MFLDAKAPPIGISSYGGEPYRLTPGEVIETHSPARTGSAPFQVGHPVPVLSAEAGRSHGGTLWL